MTSKIKTLGLALIAAFAMSAVAASAASAAPWEFHSEAAPVTLTGAQEGQDVFKTTAGLLRVECTTANYVGTVSTTTTKTVEVEPAYANCTGFGGVPATIHMNGCAYLFHAEGEATEGSVDITCPAGNEITITAISGGTIKCTVHVPPQNTRKTVKFVNVNNNGGDTREITVEVNLTGITYTETDGTGLGSCGNSGLRHDGTYTGKALITGEEDKAMGAAHKGIWVS